MGDVALCSEGMDSRGGPHGFKRWPPPLGDVALCSAWHLVPYKITGQDSRNVIIQSSSNITGTHNRHNRRQVVNHIKRLIVVWWQVML